MAKYEIVIKVKDQNKNTDVDDTKTESDSTDAALGNNKLTYKDAVKKVSGFYASTALVRSAVHAGIGLMSVKTGNDIQQQRTEAIMGLVESGIGIGIAFATNPALGAVAVAGKAISMFSEMEHNRAQIYTQSLSAYQVRERSGGTFNRSRQSGDF